MTEHRVVSADGVSLGVEFLAQGSETVLLVHGTCGARTDWALVAPLLAERYRVVTMDRRGRGSSRGADDPYSLQLEIADVAAVVDSIEGPVHLVGHSFGGLCALGAAARTPVRSLVLYEPPAAGEHVSDDDISIARGLIDAGDLEGATVHFLERVAAIPIEEINVIRALDAPWATMVAGVHTVQREAAAVKQWRAVDVGAIDVPTLQMRGELTTAPIYLEGAQRIRPLLRLPHEVTITDQRHLAIGFDPSQFVDHVVAFLTAVR